MEVDSIAALDLFTWNRLARMIDGMCGFELRTAVLNSAMTSIGYLYREAFHMCEMEPLSLTQGDIATNIAQVKDLIGPIKQGLVMQMREMMWNHVDQEKIVAAVTLMKDTSFSIQMVEQAHASGAVLHRHHREYTERTHPHSHDGTPVPCTLQTGRPTQGDPRHAAIVDGTGEEEVQYHQR